jgi:hypothetical protein
MACHSSFPFAVNPATNVEFSRSSTHGADLGHIPCVVTIPVPHIATVVSGATTKQLKVILAIQGNSIPDL